MFDLIEKLRAKPEKTKTKIAFLSAFLVTGVIFVFWIGIIFPSWKNSQTPQNVVENKEPSPFDSLNTILSKSFKSIGEELNQLKNETSTFSKDLQGVSTSSTDSNYTQNSQN